jgi:hypothetical protein
MERVRSVLRKSYFHGDISTRDAEGQLAGKQVGTFLVRFSTSSPGFYTISKVSSDGSIQHQRIIHHPNQPAFYINNRVRRFLPVLLLVFLFMSTANNNDKYIIIYIIIGLRFARGSDQPERERAQPHQRLPGLPLLGAVRGAEYIRLRAVENANDHPRTTSRGPPVAGFYTHTNKQSRFYYKRPIGGSPVVRLFLSSSPSSRPVSVTFPERKKSKRNVFFKLLVCSFIITASLALS